MSNVYQVGSTWPGFSGIRHLVIFGDSYSAVGYDDDERVNLPNASQPLGIPFPGSTYNEPGLPNWVGYLITKYCPVPRFNPSADQQDSDYTKSPLLVYDYARGGDTVAGVHRQIKHSFIPSLVKERVVPWQTTDSLFITWVGINDCAYISDPSQTMLKLFSAQEELFNAGARNFLFIDIPPINRSPAVPKRNELKISTRFLTWNSELHLGIQQFCQIHPDATVLLFSSFKLFQAILDMPQVYEFDKGDVRRHGGSVWVDDLHPTSKVHDHIANNLADFLQEIAASPVEVCSTLTL